MYLTIINYFYPPLTTVSPASSKRREAEIRDRSLEEMAEKLMSSPPLENSSYIKEIYKLIYILKCRSHHSQVLYISIYREGRGGAFERGTWDSLGKSMSLLGI